MKHALCSVALAVTLGMGLSPGTSPVAARTPEGPSSTEDSAEVAPQKVTPEFVRRSWRDQADQSWWSGEIVQLSPNTGRRHVFLQIKKKGKWVNVARQTTFKNGIFDFGTTNRRRNRALQSKIYDVSVPNRYFKRVFVPGNATYRSLSSPVWIQIWG